MCIIIRFNNIINNISTLNYGLQTSIDSATLKNDRKRTLTSAQDDITF